MSAKHPIIEIISDDLYDPSNEPQLDHPPSIASSSWTSGDSKLPSRYNDFDSRVLASPSFSVRFPTPIAHSCELAIDSEWSQVRNDLLSCLEQLDALLSRFSPRSTDSSQANSSSSALTFASLPPPLLAPRLVAEMLLLLHSAVVPEPAAATETPTPFQWTNAQLANRASQLESLLLQNLRVESLDALFACPVRPSGREDEPSSPYLCALPPLVRTLLAEPTCASSGALPLERNECVPAWSRTPWLLTSLVSLLSRARFPALRGAVLELALGTALNLLDVRSPSRLLALQLAQHTLAECVCAELRATGLAQALYAALTPLTFQTGDEAFQRVFVRALHSTLIDAIRVLDPFPVLPPADLMQRVSSVLSEWPHAAHDERARVDALLALVDEELRAADDATDSGSTGARAAATARTPSANAAPEQSSSVSVTRFEFCVERVLYLLRMEAKSGACEALADALLEYLQAASPQPQPPSPLSRSLAAHESGARRRPPTRPLGSVVPLAEPLLYTLEICLEHHTGSYAFCTLMFSLVAYSQYLFYTKTEHLVVC